MKARPTGECFKDASESGEEAKPSELRRGGVSAGETYASAGARASRLSFPGESRVHQASEVGVSGPRGGDRLGGGGGGGVLGGDGPATRLRRTDSAWGGARRAYVLVPLGTRRELHGLLRRMAGDLEDRAELRAVCFPDDAVTEHALLEALDTDVALGHPAGSGRDADVESIWSISSAESREAS